MEVFVELIFPLTSVGLTDRESAFVDDRPGPVLEDSIVEGIARSSGCIPSLVRS